MNESGVPASIVAGGNGQFDVLDDGTLVFSKQRAGRFPDEGEIAGLLSAR